MPPLRELRQEAHADAVPAERRQLEVHGVAQERVGELRQDPGAVAGVRVCPGGATVLHVGEHGERAGDRLVTLRAVEPRDEADAARVVLEGRVVEPLCLTWLWASPAV